MFKKIALATVALSLLAGSANANSKLMADAMRTAENGGIIASVRVYKETCREEMPSSLDALYESIVSGGDYDGSFVAKMTKKYRGEVKSQGKAKWCDAISSVLSR